MDFARHNPRRAAEDIATMRFEDPETGVELSWQEQPIEIDFIGLDSTEGKAAQARFAKAQDQRSKRRKAQRLADMAADQIVAGAEEIEDLRAAFFADMARGWRNLAYLSDDKADDPDAEPTLLKFSRENAEMFFKTRPWFQPQVDRFLADRLHWRRKSGA
ncbi:MAG: hypothetical protein AAFR44_07485 [Pseudomonadota bacterium]